MGRSKPLPRGKKRSGDVLAKVRAAIRRRMRVSAQEIQITTHRRMSDYHAGCVGMGYCLLDDLQRIKKRRTGAAAAGA